MTDVSQLLAALSRKDRKNDIRDQLLEIANRLGAPLSRARADNVANRFKRGLIELSTVEHVAALMVEVPSVGSLQNLARHRSGKGASS